MTCVVKLILYYFLYQLLLTFPVNLVVEVCHFPTINATGITMILSGVLMIRHLLRFGYVDFGLKNLGEVSVKTILLSLPFLLAGMFFFNLCSEFVPLPNLLENTFMDMSRNVFGILSITVMAPLVEELLFRGAIEGHLLKQGKRPAVAILVSALLFGLVHINPAQVPFAFAIGSLFGWLYYRTGSVIPGVIGHFLNNSIAVVTMALQTPEELGVRTVDWLGKGSTYALLLLSAVVMVGMFLYLKKNLPPASPCSAAAA